MLTTPGTAWCEPPNGKTTLVSCSSGTSMKRSVRGSARKPRGSPAALVPARASSVIAISTLRIGAEYDSRRAASEHAIARPSRAGPPGTEPRRGRARTLPQELDGLIRIPSPCHLARQEQMRRARRLLQGFAEERIALDPTRHL